MKFDRSDLKRLVRLNQVLAELPTRDRLDLLALAWAVTAGNARTEALMIPGGFPAEQTRQVEHLRALVALVAADVPDLEMERLYHEGDFEGMARRLRQLMDREP